LGLPDGVGWRDYLPLFGPAIRVFLIGFAEGLGAAKTYATRAGYEVNANRELAGLGAANLGSGLSSGMVVNGSLSKTAVNSGAGAKSQVSGLVVAVLVIITLLFLTSLFELLPETTLAAVVIAAVIELVDIGSLRRLYGVWTARLAEIYGHAARADFAAAIAAMLGVLIFDTLPGLVIGIGISMLLLLYRSSRPHVATLAKQGEVWLDTDRHPDLPTRPDAVIVRVEVGVDVRQRPTTSSPRSRRSAPTRPRSWCSTAKPAHSSMSARRQCWSNSNRIWRVGESSSVSHVTSGRSETLWSGP
jgi:SulP family sulfate permease